MRNALVVLLMVVITALAVSGVAGGEGSVNRVRDSGGLTIRVPVRWHLANGRLSDMSDPAPRLGIASFRARLSHETCAQHARRRMTHPRLDASSAYVTRSFSGCRPGSR